MGRVEVYVARDGWQKTSRMFFWSDAVACWVEQGAPGQVAEFTVVDGFEA